MRQYPPRRKKPPRVVGCHARLSRLPGLAFFRGRRCCLELSGYLSVAPRPITQLVQSKMAGCGARPGYQVVSNIWLDEAWAVDDEKRRLMITVRGWLSLVPVCAGSIYWHYSGHRYSLLVIGLLCREFQWCPVPSDETCTIEGSGAMQPALCIGLSRSWKVDVCEQKQKKNWEPTPHYVYCNIIKN